MSRSPTDTLILTGLEEDLLNDPKPIIQFLAQKKREIEFITLPKFGRILLLCASKIEAEITYQDLKDSNYGTQFNISYSIKDNDTLIRSTATTSDEFVEYLELPSEHGSKRFLISPPLSPPPEWDHWQKAEEGPSKQTLHSAEELSHLLWERLGHRDESEDRVRKYEPEDNDPQKTTNKQESVVHDLKVDPEVLFRDIDNGVPAIILDSVKTNNETTPKRIVCKTAMPPPLE
ncbi:calcipressin-like protein [[Candida] railenensis]|uniref:Calcipressin-like protein n=1 Tax=[Candida] railenensis TaxID=45579 RepID=A0A9P0W014_9ASCO|nr:calcipressin-like protein [[Candida] railenensis]